MEILSEFPEFNNRAWKLTNQRPVKLVCQIILANHMKEKLVYSETILNFPGSYPTKIEIHQNMKLGGVWDTAPYIKKRKVT